MRRRRRRKHEPPRRTHKHGLLDLHYLLPLLASGSTPLEIRMLTVFLFAFVHFFGGSEAVEWKGSSSSTGCCGGRGGSEGSDESRSNLEEEEGEGG